MLRVSGNSLFGNVVGEAQTGMGKYARRYVKILCFFSRENVVVRRKSIRHSESEQKRLGRVL